MTPELVQAVARAIEQSLLNARLVPGDKSPYTPEALAAIALIAPILRAQALEEAARVLKEKTTEHRAEAKRLLNTIDKSDTQQVYLVCCQEARADGYQGAEAAIRALIPSEAGPASS